METRKFPEKGLSKLFGSLKRRTSGQEFKNLVREGWNP
jgi:hypothetical protein